MGGGKLRKSRIGLDRLDHRHAKSGFMGDLTQKCRFMHCVTTGRPVVWVGVG